MSYWPFGGFLNGDDSPYDSEGWVDDDPGPYARRHDRLFHHKMLANWCTHAKAIGSTEKAILFEGKAPKGKKELISFWVPLKLIRTREDAKFDKDSFLEEEIYIWKGFKPTILLKTEKSS